MRYPSVNKGQLIEGDRGLSWTSKHSMRCHLCEIRPTIFTKGGGLQFGGDTVKLNVAADIYVRRKRDEGLVYSWPAGYLAALCRQVGDVSLDQITSREIATFLEGPKTSPSTWLEKYHMLRGFFDFWLARGEIDVLPMPVKRRVSDRPFLPYIFTHAEIRLLLNGARNTRKVKRSKIDHTTLRTILIFLYGTGLRVGEALRLQEEDVDLEKGAISVHGNRFNRSRIIPICPDLRKVLEAYATSRREEMNDPYFFRDKAGERLSYSKLEKMFRRLRHKSEIRRRDDGGCYQPRMYDLRHTFATHRIAAWIKHGANLNRMLPALAIYMGLTDFRSTEKYLAFAPERFRAQLVKLSPQRGKKRWRDDPELMKFLSALSDDSGKSRRLNGGTSIRVDSKSVAPRLPRHLQLRQRNDLRTGL